MSLVHQAWLQSADNHLATARRELGVVESPHYAAVCMHAQWVALACLRARLAMEEIPFPVTPHLVVLLELCLELEPEWERFRESLRVLTHRVSSLDNLDYTCTWEQAQESFTCALAFRDEVRNKMGLRP